MLACVQWSSIEKHPHLCACMACTPACQGHPALSTIKSEALDIVFGKKVLKQKKKSILT